MESQITIDLESDIRRMNPWWKSMSDMPVIPPVKRHINYQIRKRLEAGLAPLVVVRGSRQIGKTTSQLQIIQDLLKEGFIPKHLFRIQFDELTDIMNMENPILRLVEWYENRILGKSINRIAQEGGRLFFFLMKYKIWIIGRRS